MGRNLPPGVSVSDLPGNRPRDEPECFENECSAVPSVEAMEDGYPLCEDHDTPENREAWDEWNEAEKRRVEGERLAAESERARELEKEQRGTPEVFLDDDGTPRDEDQLREDMGVEDDEWNPEPATLRDGETTDISGHAARNLETITRAEEEGYLSSDEAEQAREKIRENDEEDT